MSAEGDTATDESQTVDLYEKWRRIYPEWVSGGFQTWRRVTLVVLLVIYYAGPWLRWDGAPGVRFDLAARRFTVFWQTFAPDEFVLLAWLLSILALALFVATIAAGRVFCGWICPQTVWTNAYLILEKFIEGDRVERQRRDKNPFTRDWATRKTIKFTAWALVAFSISVTFVGYFTEIRSLLPRVATFQLTEWEIIFLLLPAAGSFFFQGILREQVCFHMCPYARFQSVMLDRDSLIISYDPARGEPRGHRRRNADPDELALGHCIDCERCVRVCPTGIDIRDGLQYQCIGCAACVDACGEIMDRMGYGETLVRYSSENRDAGQPARWLRPRLAGYAAMMTAIMTLFAVTVATRLPLDLDVIRDRNRLYRESWDGSVENVYSLRISNRADTPQAYAIDFTAEVPLEYRGERVVSVEPGDMRIVPVSLLRAGDTPAGESVSEVEFTIRSEADARAIARATSSFHQPKPEIRAASEVRG